MGVVAFAGAPGGSGHCWLLYKESPQMRWYKNIYAVILNFMFLAYGRLFTNILIVKI